MTREEMLASLAKQLSMAEYLLRPLRSPTLDDPPISLRNLQSKQLAALFALTDALKVVHAYLRQEHQGLGVVSSFVDLGLDEK